MPPSSRDLFSDTTMSFGDHLEALRSHLWKAVAGVFVGCVLCLFIGEKIVAVIRYPLDKALEPHGVKLKDDTGGRNPLSVFWAKLRGQELPKPVEPEPEGPPPDPVAIREVTGKLTVDVPVSELLRSLHQALPSQFPAPPPPVVEVAPTAAAEAPVPAVTEKTESGGTDNEKMAEAKQPPKEPTVKLTLSSPALAEMQQVVLDMRKPVALSPQEPFMIYLKVSGLAGLVLASPWVFYQLWLFVAEGLYMHERKYMYLFGSLSLVLFIVGVMFCFWMVLPLVLRFLMTYNEAMHVRLDPRLSEYLTFASILPLMFGIGFQLPLVMVFLERMNIVSIQVFIEKWRIAVFAISFISMLLTPPEPISMMMMMGPMVCLYFMGIMLCKWTSSKRDVAPVPSV
jgi:sec-independent protein translocase protein TatC